MKRSGILILVLLAFALVLPVAAFADTSVRVTLSSNDVWVGDDHQANLKIDVLNTGTEPVTVTGYTVNGQTEAADITVNAGAVYRFNVKTTLDFGGESQKSVISNVSVTGLGTVSSNAMVLYQKTSVPVAFSVDPQSVVVDSGETVAYTIVFKNTGAYEYTDVTISMDGVVIVPAFSCAAGETKTFSTSKTYTQPSEHIFSYTFDYLEADGSTKTSGGSERVLISVYAKQPTGTLLAGAEFLPGVLTAMADENSGYDLRLYLKNHSDTVLSSVHVYDQNGTDYGGWSTIGIGKTAGMTVTLTPVEETIYTFTAYGTDANGEIRMIPADAVLIAVGSLPDDFGIIEPAADASAENTEPVTIAEASSNKKIYIVLGVIVGAIILSLLVIIMISSGRKTIVRKNPKKKSRKSKSGRNIF